MLTKWKCPKCGVKVEAQALQVTHRCPFNKSQPVNFVEEVNNATE